MGIVLANHIIVFFLIFFLSGVVFISNLIKLKKKNLFLAPKFGDQPGQHRVQHPDDGVGQVHLCPGEGRRTGTGGDHRHGGPKHPHPQAHLCRQRHHEPCKQSYCT